MRSQLHLFLCDLRRSGRGTKTQYGSLDQTRLSTAQTKAQYKKFMEDVDRITESESVTNIVVLKIINRPICYKYKSNRRTHLCCERVRAVVLVSQWIVEEPPAKGLS